MKLSLQDLRRVAAEAADQEGLSFEVAGATHAEGGPAHAEIIFARRSADADTKHVVVGVDREMSEQACRDAIRLQLRRLLQPNGAGTHR